MRPLSSSEALAPAFHRTWQLLCRPFRWTSYLRLTATAAITSCFFINFRYTLPGASAVELPSIPTAFRQASGFGILSVIAALFLVDLFILYCYFMARLRFALFDSLVHARSALAPGFNLYEHQAVRFFRAKVLVWLSIAGLTVAIIAVVAIVVLSVTTLRTPEGTYDAGVFLVLFFPAVGFAAFVLILSILMQIVVNDFILPHMALENASLREAWRSVRKAIRADKESFFSYFLLRIVILIVVGPILAVLAFALLWPIFWVLGASATGYAALLDDAPGFLAGLQVTSIILFSSLAAVVGAAGSAFLGGPLMVLLRAHALYFYGSRYKSLGDALYPMQSPQTVPAAAALPAGQSVASLGPGA